MGFSSFALGGLLLAVGDASSTAQVSNSTYNILLSETLPGNLLPKFKFMLGVVEGDSGSVRCLPVLLIVPIAAHPPMCWRYPRSPAERLICSLSRCWQVPLGGGHRGASTLRAL